MASILRRAEQRKFIFRSQGIYLRRMPEIDAEPSLDSRLDALRQMNHLIEQVLEFASSRHSIAWTVAQGSDALFAFVSQHAVDALTLVSGNPIFEPSVPTTPETDFVLGSFIAHAELADPIAYEALKTAVRGRMLASCSAQPPD